MAHTPVKFRKIIQVETDKYKPLLKERSLFLKNFLRNPLRNASVIPSSPKAAQAMIAGINWNEVNTVVELGPGNGVFTEQILAACRPDTTVILIEIEDSYVAILKDKFGDRVQVEQNSSHLLDEILAKYGKSHADLIVSGLPFLPKEIKEPTYQSILRQAAQGAIFRFFTYMPPIMKMVYRDMPLREISFVAANIPPMWIYGMN